MVLPLLIPLLGAAVGAAGNVAGGLIGASAQREADDKNYAISLLNYYAQERARRQAQQEAQRQEAEGKLGTTDADQNRTYFDPARGWVTERGEKDTQRAAQYAEEEQSQLQDLKTKREDAYKARGRRGRSANTADALMEAMLRNYHRDPQQQVNRKNLMTTEAANEGFDSALTQAMIDAKRTGSGGQAKLASQIGRDKYSTLRKAFMENQEGAVEGEDNRFMSEQANLANLRAPFAAEGYEGFDATYNPRNIEGMSASALQNAMAGGSATSSRLQQAMNMPHTDLNYNEEPNFGIASTIVQGAGAIAAGLNNYDANRGMGMSSYGGYAQQNRNSVYPSTYSDTTNPRPASFYKQNTGLW